MLLKAKIILFPFSSVSPQVHGNTCFFDATLFNKFSFLALTGRPITAKRDTRVISASERYRRSSYEKETRIIALGTASSLSSTLVILKTDDSNSKWEQSREGTQDFAFLEARSDLEDDFFFALQVIGQEDFFGSALSM